MVSPAQVAGPARQGTQIASHAKRMGDQDYQAEKTSPELASIRAPHLEALTAIETFLDNTSPLAISYDVTRMQPPHFNEFTYSELLGHMWVTPQSAEATARLIDMASKDPSVKAADFPKIELRDKYRLDTTPYALPARVVFLPADNLMSRAVNFDELMRAMFEDPDLVIKPHPLSSEGLVRRLGRMFGYDRIMNPKESGAALIPTLEYCYVTSATEMGIYAVLEGKEVRNLSRFSQEPRLAFHALYRLVWGRSPAEAREMILTALASPLSGFLMVGDAGMKDRAGQYFAAAMELRASLAPLIQEYTADVWAEMVMGGPPPAPATQAKTPAATPAPAKA